MLKNEGFPLTARRKRHVEWAAKKTGSLTNSAQVPMARRRQARIITFRRIGSIHAEGTGGKRHSAGSDNSPENVGIIRVPSGPNAARSAAMTVCAAPHTYPNRLSDTCAHRTSPDSIPAWRSPVISAERVTRLLC